MRPAHLLPALLLACGTATATTWSGQNIIDPVDGSRCQVQSMASSGSYIYALPEKYDQVFIPVTSMEGIWYCEGSGFATFIGDLSLDPVERDRIAGYLAAQPRLPAVSITAAARLQRVEAIYALRDIPPGRRIMVDRILAYDFETLAGDAARARGHRQVALTAMLQRLAEESLPQLTRMEYLFVSANYLREFGDAARADRLLTQLESLVASLGEAGRKDYPGYLVRLLPSARTIAPGGRLAPLLRRGFLRRHRPRSR